MAVLTFGTLKAFIQFLLNWKLKGGIVVEQNVANVRASICAGCHNNKPDSEIKGGCGVCNKGANFALNFIREKIIGKSRTTYDSKLLTCTLCKCDLKTKVWIPIKALGLTEEDANAWPSFCWIKKITENQEV